MNKDVLALLDAGDEASARTRLNEVLSTDPNNSVATKLLEQITGEPVKMLGAQNFSYKVQHSDTLAKLADEYLGDRHKFYILARYNDIKIPNKLAVGQTIKIPGKKPKSRPPVDTPPRTLPAPVIAQPKAPDDSIIRQLEAEANAAFFRQDMLAVIAKCDRVIAMDPNRDKCKELKRKAREALR